MTDNSIKKIKLETKFRQIATEGLRLSISPGISPHMAKLIKICMNEVIITNLMTIMTKPTKIRRMTIDLSAYDTAHNQCNLCKINTMKMIMFIGVSK